MELKGGVVSGQGSNRNWKPTSQGTSGEIAMMQALQGAKIPFRWQVPLKTKFKEFAFLIDFLIPVPASSKVLGLCIEVQGKLHYQTWTGRTAVKRMAKDEAKRACLEGEGYRVLEITDTLVKRHPEQAIQQIREALSHD